MKFKDEIPRKVFLVSPDNPAYADVTEPKFVASIQTIQVVTRAAQPYNSRSVDRDDTR